jgi:hypothetical protein
MMNLRHFYPALFNLQTPFFWQCLERFEKLLPAFCLDAAGESIEPQFTFPSPLVHLLATCPENTLHSC